MAKLIPCPKCESTDVYSNSLPGGIRTECDGCGFHGPIRATSELSQAAWLAEAADEKMQQLRQDNDALLQAVKEFRDFIATAPVESGVCCCGDNMESHPTYSGHGPVDTWDHAKNLLLEKTKHLVINSTINTDQNTNPFDDPANIVASGQHESRHFDIRRSPTSEAFGISTWTDDDFSLSPPQKSYGHTWDKAIKMASDWFALGKR